MLQRLSDDGFDLILTKALSRLNRDELNSLMLNSMLLEHNATVLTLEDRQVHDFEDMNSGLLHSIKYAMDAQFVKQQSINGRKTQELRCERKELSAKDPENADYYNSNAEKYIEKLEKLDSEIESTIKNSSQSEIAFGGPFSYAYFIKRYNLKFVTAYDSCGENGEPSVDKIFKVIEEIKQNNIPVVFYKELSSGNIVKTISEETGAKMLEFNSVHTVTQKQLEDGETYLSIMYQNLKNIKQALPSK